MTDSEKLDIILNKVERLEEVYEKVDKIDKVYDKVGKIDEIYDKVERIDEVYDKVGKIDGLCDKVSNLEIDMKEVKQRTSKIELIIENEIRVNIQRIAEGHSDLARNLLEAKKPSSEVEVLSVKVNKLESDVRELKQRIS